MKLETFLRYIIFSYFFSLFIDDSSSKIPIPINGETCISGNAETYPGSKNSPSENFSIGTYVDCVFKQY